MGVLEAIAPLIDATATSCVFMTKDGYGIPAAQCAGNVFVKYGNDLNLRTGVHLNRVAWHKNN